MSTTPTTTSTPIETVDAHRFHNEQTVHFLATNLPLILEMFNTANKRVKEPQAKALVSLGDGIVQAVEHCGLLPVLAHEQRRSWAGAAYFVNDRKAGTRALGLHLQLKAMTAIPGFGDAVIQCLCERLAHALGPRLD